MVTPSLQTSKSSLNFLSRLLFWLIWYCLKTTDGYVIMGKFPYPKEGHIHRYKIDWGFRMRREKGFPQLWTPRCRGQGREDSLGHSEAVVSNLLWAQLPCLWCDVSGENVCIYTWRAMSLKDSGVGLEHPEWAQGQILFFLSDPGPRRMMVGQQLWAHQRFSSLKFFTWMARDGIRRWGQCYLWWNQSCHHRWSDSGWKKGSRWLSGPFVGIIFTSDRKLRKCLGW